MISNCYGNVYVKNVNKLPGLLKRNEIVAEMESDIFRAQPEMFKRMFHACIRTFFSSTNVKLICTPFCWLM